MKVLYIYLLIINTVAFFTYMIDKIKAMRHKWRISEAVLIGLAFIGGALGSLLGMIICRHKIRKPKFFILVPLFLIIWAVGIWYFHGAFSGTYYPYLENAKASDNQYEVKRLDCKMGQGKDALNILMLGNSFTYYEEMPKILANELGANVTAVVQPGGFLRDRLIKGTEAEKLTREALTEKKWDYVVIQDHSMVPCVDKEGFLDVVGRFCRLAKENGAKPVLYATWAYENGGPALLNSGLGYEEMFQSLYDAYHEAGALNEALVADVGLAFFENADYIDLYNHEDGRHQNANGAQLIADVLAQCISPDIQE